MTLKVFLTLPFFIIGTISIIYFSKDYRSTDKNDKAKRTDELMRFICSSLITSWMIFAVVSSIWEFDSFLSGIVMPVFFACIVITSVVWEYLMKDKNPEYMKELAKAIEKTNEYSESIALSEEQYDLTCELTCIFFCLCSVITGILLFPLVEIEEGANVSWISGIIMRLFISCEGGILLSMLFSCLFLATVAFIFEFTNDIELRSKGKLSGK